MHKTDTCGLWKVTFIDSNKKMLAYDETQILAEPLENTKSYSTGNENCLRLAILHKYDRVFLIPLKSDLSIVRYFTLLTSYFPRYQKKNGHVYLVTLYLFCAPVDD